MAIFVKFVKYLQIDQVLAKADADTDDSEPECPRDFKAHKIRA